MVATTQHRVVQQDVPLGDVWSYDLQTDTWEMMADSFFPSQNGNSAVVIGDELVSFGGMAKGLLHSWAEQSEWRTLDDFWVFDLVTKKWEEREVQPSLARAYNSLVGWKDERGENVVAAFGGYRTVEQPMGEEVAVVFDETLLSSPSFSLNGTEVVSTWRKAISRDLVSPTVSHRLEHSAVLSEKYGAMFVWGGRFQYTADVSGLWALNVHGMGSRVMYKLAEGDGIDDQQAAVALHMMLAALMFLSMMFSAMCGIISRQQAQEGNNGEGGGGRRRRGLNQEVIDTLPLKAYKIGVSKSEESTVAPSESSDNEQESTNDDDTKKCTQASLGVCDQRSEEDDCCPICLVEYGNGDQVRTLPCNHEFHKDCVDSWLATNASCPACRHSLSELAGTSTSGSTYVLSPGFLLPYGLGRDAMTTESSQSAGEQSEQDGPPSSSSNWTGLFRLPRTRRSWYPGNVRPTQGTTIAAEEFEDGNVGVHIEMPYIASLQLTEEMPDDETVTPRTGEEQIPDDWLGRAPRTRRMRLGRDVSNRRRLRRAIRRGMVGGSAPLTETLEPADAALV
eukprot:CAMPEP_0118720628 /NCGR_PEP_ID=MMETSP0800-20121206/30218_1 /TAXON_ID=210618 ORGANISM="Striatella unipunctata, Strain CCMP2910" /NCGR_SAMPLE_ID=MMETSP0800 /ASSEMBLY_ACC=CAM_ASM_000638 /LENGTH=562 /DNA_ID=CAMNT_0006628293 /DNA_START=6 /DNA_END=1695 /DNA_ORIENTATION=+